MTKAMKTKNVKLTEDELSEVQLAVISYVNYARERNLPKTAAKYRALFDKLEKLNN